MLRRHALLVRFLSCTTPCLHRSVPGKLSLSQYVVAENVFLPEGSLPELCREAAVHVW